MKNVFDKYNEGHKGYLTIDQMKNALLYIFGQKIKTELLLKIIRGYLKKKTLNKTIREDEISLKILLEENSLIEDDDGKLLYSNYSLIKDLIKINENIFECIVDNLNKDLMSNSFCCINLYNSLLYPNKKSLDYFTFKAKVLNHFPSLTDNFIQNIFFHLNIEKTGTISYKEFEILGKDLLDHVGIKVETNDLSFNLVSL